jgi:hypothetical protein
MEKRMFKSNYYLAAVDNWGLLYMFWYIRTLLCMALEVEVHTSFGFLRTQASAQGMDG